MSGAITLLSKGEAHRLTERIQSTAHNVREGLFRLRNLVDEAKSSNVWAMLDYPSWTAYLADTLSAEPMRLGREERQELVGYLAGEGLSSRAIATATGASRTTVIKDLREQVVQPVPPAEPEPEFNPTPTLPPSEHDWIEPGAPAFDPTTGEVIEPVVTTETHTLKVVTGLDGKEYKRKPDPAVADILDADQELQDSKYMKAFAAALPKAHEFMLFDAERIGQLASPDVIRSIEHIIKGATEFLEKTGRDHNGLRLIEGGKR